MRPGDRVILDARDSTDPDGQDLQFEWRYYAEAGTYQGPLPELAGAATAQASFVAPEVAATATLHLLLIVTDHGSPPLSRYQRVIVTVSPRQP